MRYSEADLPGFGKKFSIKLKSGQELILIILSTGKRELYLMQGEEASCVIELTQDEAKELGFLMAGAKYEAVSMGRMEAILKELVIEWVKVEEGSKFIDKTIAELEIRRKTGVSVVAIDRQGKLIPTPDPFKEKILPGDILVVIGTRQQLNSFLELCGKCST
ncbi:MAG: cation:proton antiporter regulatory subunit [Candidatus Caldipriscus sp.]